MLGVDIIERMHPRQMVANFLLAGYCYYQLDLSPMTDAAFDLLAKQLLAVYDTIDHPHLHLIDKQMLVAGSLLLARDQYPSRVRGPAPGYKADGSARWWNTGAEKYYDECMSGTTARLMEPHLHPVGYRAPTASLNNAIQQGLF